MGLYFVGERDEADEWFAEAAALAPVSAQWLAGTSSLAYRSLIAAERGCGEEQRALAESAAQFGRSTARRTPSARSRWRWGHRWRRLAATQRPYH